MGTFYMKHALPKTYAWKLGSFYRFQPKKTNLTYMLFTKNEWPAYKSGAMKRLKWKGVYHFADLVVGGGVLTSFFEISVIFFWLWFQIFFLNRYPWQIYKLTFFDFRSLRSVRKVVLFGHILTFLATLDIQAPSRQLGMKFLDPKPLQIAS